MSSEPSREKLSSRIGFLFLAAGCAIGLGNIWRFPYITGRYGGMLFVAAYIFFLVIIGFPIMMAELAVGRASESNLAGALKKLSPNGKRWAPFGQLAMVGNVVLLMFYSVITGWLLLYTWKYITGAFAVPQDFKAAFGGMVGNWQIMLGFTALALAGSTAVLMGGLRAGVERITKFMMAGLFLLLIILIVLCLRFKGSEAGLKFFLLPDWNRFIAGGIWPAIHAALMQAFFTLSLGVGSIAICGSYTSKDHTLASESITIIALDTCVAIGAGLIIFPLCFAFNVNPDAGPSLIFITLPNAFVSIPGGRFLGLLFFIFLCAAALSTLIAVMENIVDWCMQSFSLPRKISSLIVGTGLLVLSLPCIFGFNLWSSFNIPKIGGVLDAEDFIISDNLLPLGSLLIILFCCWKLGWGMDRFLGEVNTGKGVKIPAVLGVYLKYVLPVLIFGIWCSGIVYRFFITK